MAQNKWTDGSDNWTLDPSTDWSTGVLPGLSDDVTINQGNPLITTNVGKINSLTDSAQLSIENGGALEVATDVTNSDTLGLDDDNTATGSSLTVDGGLTNTANIDVDTGSGAGGTTLSVKGTLTNDGTFNFGNGGLSSDVTVSFGDVDNTGSLNITGNSNGNAAKATFDAGAGVAPTTLDTSIDITGNAELDYGSGAITAIDSSGSLTLTGADAQVDVTGKSGANSALALTSNAGGLYLESGATLTVGSFTNSGTLGLDDGNQTSVSGSSLTVDGDLTNYLSLNVATSANPPAGTTLTVTGTLTNDNTINFGRDDLPGNSTISVGGVDRFGALNITGNTSSGTTNKATFDTGSTIAPTTLLYSGISLIGDAEVDFGSGAITTIDGSSNLALYGADAQINVTGKSGTNSALALTSNAGSLYLDGGPTLDVKDDFTNSGNLDVDSNQYASLGSSLTFDDNLTNTSAGVIEVDMEEKSGTSHFSVAGLLTNAGNFYFGEGDNVAPTAITLGSLATSGMFGIAGSANAVKTVTVSGTAADSGSMVLSSGATFSAASLDIQAGGTVYVEGGRLNAPVTIEGKGLLDAMSGTVATPVTIEAGGKELSVLNSPVNAATIDGGTFEINGGGVVSAAKITFTSKGGTLQIDNRTMPTNEIDGLNGGKAEIVLSSVAFDASAPAPVLINNATEHNVLDVTEHGVAYDFQLDPDADYSHSHFFASQNTSGSGTVIACYCRGTAILTAAGEVPVEDLTIGDRLVTAYCDLRPIKWIGTRSYAGRFANANQSVLPICFKAGSLGENTPRRDLWVSPQHAMYLDGALIPAEHLVNGMSIVQADRVDQVDYFHIELDSHDVIIAEGALSESFVDDHSRAMFHNAQTFRALYPHAEEMDAVYCAPRIEDGFALHAIRRRLAARAGLPMLAPVDLGMLHGGIDRIKDGVITGWARNEFYPDARLCLDILVNDRVVMQVLADQFRSDLLRGGIGDGAHAFEVQLPAMVSNPDGRTVTVRRSADGAVLPLLTAQGMACQALARHAA